MEGDDLINTGAEEYKGRARHILLLHGSPHGGVLAVLLCNPTEEVFVDPSPLVFCISLCPLFCHCCFEDPKNRISSPGEFYVPLAIDGTFCFLLYGEG